MLLAENYLLRPAAAQDSAAIRSLIHAVRINPIGLNWRHFIVAVDSSGSLLGCGQLKRHSDGSIELASIAVVETARQKGIASAIIRALLGRESQRPLYLMCRGELAGFYPRFGFRPVGREAMSPYFRTIDRIFGGISRRPLPEDRLCIMRLD